MAAHQNTPCWILIAPFVVMLQNIKAEAICSRWHVCMYVCLGTLSCQPSQEIEAVAWQVASISQTLFWECWAWWTGIATWSREELCAKWPLSVGKSRYISLTRSQQCKICATWSFRLWPVQARGARHDPCNSSWEPFANLRFVRHKNSFVEAVSSQCMILSSDDVFFSKSGLGQAICWASQ